MKSYLKIATAVMVAGVALSAPVANAETICSGAAGNGVSPTADTQSGTTFVRTTFVPQCSNNVLLEISQDSVKLWGGSASKKGKSAFAASSNGGAVKAIATTCASTGCSFTDTGRALQEASAFGSS